MNKKGILILLIIIAYVFLISSFILSHLFGMLHFITYGQAFTETVRYLEEYPLNIVVGANVLLAGISTGLLVQEIKKEKK